MNRTPAHLIRTPKHPCGVYLIRCEPTGDLYVGESGDIRTRWLLHLCALRKGKHSVRAFQVLYDQHGEAAFTFASVERCEGRDSDRRAREAYWIDKLRPSLNIRGTGKPIIRRSLKGTTNPANRAFWDAFRAATGTNLERRRAAYLAMQRR